MAGNLPNCRVTLFLHESFDPLLLLFVALVFFSSFIIAAATGYIRSGKEIVSLKFSLDELSVSPAKACSIKNRRTSEMRIKGEKDITIQKGKERTGRTKRWRRHVFANK